MSTHHASETSRARAALAPYCTGTGLDIGFGGSAITPTAITMDLARPYCPSFDGDTQILQGDCRSLPFVCDGSLDFVYSSHLLEDFLWPEVAQIVLEWRAKLKVGGRLVTCCPDEQVYRAHCAATGQGYNEAHKNWNFSLGTFETLVARVTGPWKELYKNALTDTYSWHLVLEKTGVA